MIYLTGDTHGTIEIGKLSRANLAVERVEPGEDDFVIILGDFGLVFAPDGQSAEERWWLKWLDKKPWTTLFIDGNHENFARLNALPEEEWRGGRVHRVSESVLHLMRGQVFEIDGRSFFTMGGAASHDRQFRKEGRSWWPEELPSEEELARADAALDGCGRRVDYVLTHCAPTLVQGRINPTFLPDRLTEYLQHVRDTTEFGRWYFGHYHIDREYDDGFCALYNCVMPIE
ncbi:MAG: metallophosphoesterase family protein [Eggerthellaceae bacterium]